MTDMRFGGGQKGDPGQGVTELVNVKRAAKGLPGITDDELYEQIVNPALTEEAQGILAGAETARGAAEAAQGAAEAARGQAEGYALNAQDVSRIAPSWANLLTLAGTVDGEAASVEPTDTGSHQQASGTGYDGASVPNAGQYRWISSMGRWSRVSDAKSVLFARGVEGRIRLGTTADVPGYASGERYGITVSKMPQGTQLVSLVFHAASTVSVPVLVITDGAGTITTQLIGPNGGQIPFGILANVRYEIDLGTGTSRVYEPGNGARSAIDGVQAAVAAETSARQAAVNDLARRSVLSYSATTGGTSSAYTLTSTLAPEGNQLVFFIPHADSSASYPTLTVTVGGTAYPTSIGARDGTPLRVPLKAGRIYALRWGTGVSRLINDTEDAVLDDIEALQGAVAALQTGGASAETLVNPDLGKIAQVGLPVPGNQESDAPLAVGNLRPFQWQPLWRPASLVLSGAPGVVDLSHVRPGTEGYILANPGDRILAGAGRNFAGRSEAAGVQSGSVTAGAGGNSLFKVVDFSGNRFLVQEAGPAPSYGAETIGHDRMFILGGQSNGFRDEEEYGIGGFSYGLAKELASNQDISVQFVNGATGGTAIDRRSVTGGSTAYWWDVGANGGTGGPGPVLDTYMAEVAAAAAASGLAPDWTFWTQGESDAGALDSGALTTAEMQATILAVFGYIRATYPAMQFICNFVGSHDVTSQAGINAARVAYLRVVESESYCHRGAEAYDLPRRQQDIHWMGKAYAIRGARQALIWANAALGQSNATGPVVTAATRIDATTVRLSVSGGPVYCPLPVVHGPQPCGLYALAGGADPAAEPIPLTSCYLDGGLLYVTSETDLAGCQIGGPYGWAPGARGGLWIRDYNRDEFHDWAGNPLGTFLVDVV
ncbi:hypothetical protein [Mangrovicoccus ximenensis]|uniref:hypothetical protein n=1 Tax=Mangrovicoccus ximenensis TaxID=1911570 RepID=UPI000D34DF47|nr:hypothetical protein [Mangrovicoccus ximenensis]